MMVLPPERRVDKTMNRDLYVSMAECAIDFGTGTALGGLLHSPHNLANTGLLAAADEFEVSRRHAQR